MRTVPTTSSKLTHSSLYCSACVSEILVGRFWRRRLAKRRCNAIRAANEADPPAAEEVVADADAELPIAKEADPPAADAGGDGEADPPAADADAGGDGEADPPAADADAGGDGEVATATEVEA